MSVVWLTGPAGSGKSTLARALRALVHPVASVAVLDEDDVQSTTPAPSARLDGNPRAPAAQLCQTAAVLARQGIVVIVSSSDADAVVLTWNRDNLPGYREVRLQASPETIRRRQGRHSVMDGHLVEGATGAGTTANGGTVDGAPAETDGRHPGPPLEPNLTIDMDEPEPPELLAFRVGVLIPEFVVAAAGAAGLSRPWPSRPRQG